MLCNIVKTVILFHLLYTSAHSETVERNGTHLLHCVVLVCFALFLYLHLFYYFVSKLLVAVAVAVSHFCVMPWLSGKKKEEKKAN